MVSYEDIARRVASSESRYADWLRRKRRGRRVSEYEGAGYERIHPSDVKGKKAARDVSYMKKPEPEPLEPISEFMRKEKERRHERALKAIEERRVVPKGVTFKQWLSEPGNLERALKRKMVKLIAKHPNPKSKDTEDVATVGGRRYAKTDLYRPSIRERVGGAVMTTRHGTEMWWDRNKKIVFVSAVAFAAGWMIYTTWRTKQLEGRFARQRARRHALPARPEHATGWDYPFTDPHGNFDVQTTPAWDGREVYPWEQEHFAGTPHGYWWG